MHDLSDQTLSEFLDGELNESAASSLKASLAESTDQRHALKRMERLRVILRSQQVPEVADRQRSSFQSIERRLSVMSRPGFWSRWRQIQVPLPAVAAAAVVLVALASVLAWAVRPTPPAATDLMTQGQPVDVTIRVDDAEMEQVLQWLVDKEMLGEVSIQLPEQQWSIVGDPVLLKPEEYPEGFTE